MKSDLLAYYREHGPMTEVKTMRKMVTDIPPDVAVIVDYVQRILLHSHWSRAYGVELTEERRREPMLRSFEEKLVFLSRRASKTR